MTRCRPLLSSLVALACNAASPSDETSDGSTDAPGSGTAGSSTAPATTTAPEDPTSGGGTASASEATASTSDPPEVTSDGESTAAPDTGDATGTTDDATTGDGVEVYDPDLPGPCEYAEIDGEVTVDGVAVPISGYYPTGGPVPGPHPLVVLAHGFQLPASQYDEYARRLASHCYVALSADFQAGLFQPNHVAYAKQVLGAIDWAADADELAGVVDTANVGLTGHSLGGKLAVLGAVMDDRVRASITLDPVDSATMCNPQDCPDVSDMLPIAIPLGFLGETIDAMGGFMACAPAADNFQTFFAAADGPALAVTVNGANHMSFLDDVDSCGFTCNFCQAATADNDVVNALARAYVVAFYGRHLRGVAGYDDYLFGAAAQARYVETGQIKIDLK